MKKILIGAASALILAAAAAAVLGVFQDSAEKRIRKTLTELCAVGSKSSGESPALTALKANRADRVFAPRCRFNFFLNAFDGELTPTETGARILRVQAMFDWIKLDFSELEISVEGDKARASFAGSFKGRLRHGDGGDTDEIREIDSELARQPDGTWKFTRMNFRRILEK